MIAVLGLVSASKGQPPPTVGHLDFEAAEGYETGDSCPWGLAAGDIDNDGYVDLVVVNEGHCLVREADCIPNSGGTLTVFRNTGDWSSPGGGFTADTPIPFDDPNIADPREIVLTNLNGDNWLDAAVTTTTGHVLIFTNTSGSFSCSASYPLRCTSCDPQHQVLALQGLTVGDFDNDGYNDLAAASRHTYPGAVWRLFNSGSATFTVQLIHDPNMYGPWDITAGLFDDADDGWDLVTSDPVLGSVTMFQSRALGQWDREVIAPPGGVAYSSEAIVRARLDSGTTADVALTGQRGVNVGIVLVGDGAGNLTYSDEIVADPNILDDFFSDVAADRLDGNSSRDLVFVLEDSGRVAVAQNAGDATFPYALKLFSVEPAGELTAHWPKQVVIADFNDDGFKDIAVTARQDGADDPAGVVCVLLHKPATIGD